MAITQVGSILTVSPGGVHSNSGTLSPSLAVPDITVPTGTELIVVGVSTYAGTVGNDLQSVTFTKNGIDEPMTRGVGGDVSTAFWQSALFWQVLPDIGSGKSLKWDWAGSANTGSGSHMWSMTFWKGIDMDDPVRSSAGAQSGAFPLTTPTLTAQSGDKLVAFFAGFANGLEGSVDSWTGATLLSNETHLGDADGAWATADPSGNQTVSAATATNFTFTNALVAAVLKPDGGRQYVPLTNVMTASVGTASGVPVRNLPETPDSQLATVSVGTPGFDLHVVKGRVAVLNSWGVG